jgi:thiamine-monophosphate kinase
MGDEQGRGTTLAGAGEFGLIDRMLARLGKFPDDAVPVGPGDDAALVSVRSGAVLVTTDLMVEGRHFRRDWSSAADVGHKVAAANLADVAAMGGVCTALVVAFAGPPELPAEWAVELSAGIADEAASVGARVVGGDTSSAAAVTVAVTALGELAPGVAPVLRSGARPGNVLAVCGRLGWAAAGWAALGRGFRSPRLAVAAHQRPQPPYPAGPQAAAAGATAMIDVSDGLLADVGHVAAASGVVIDVTGGRLPIDEPVRTVAAAMNADPLQMVLTGGEDHALVATFPAEIELPPGWTGIGRVLDGDGGVTVDGRVPGPTGRGWDHFARR